MSQLHGNKLPNGKSSDKLAFTTNGQNETNSEPTNIVTTYTSKELSDKSFNSETSYVNEESTDKPINKANNLAYFNYSISHKNNTNKYGINWNWKSLFNTPGNITGTFQADLNGKGTKEMPISAEGVDSIPISIKPSLKYNATTNNVTDVGTNVTVKMHFPKNIDIDNNIIEDGGDIEFTTYSTNNVSLSSNASPDIQKKYNGIGLVAYNTPNPILNIEVSTTSYRDKYKDYVTVAKIINDKGEETNQLKYSDGKFSGGTRIKFLPNLPKGGKGTLKGKMVLNTSLSTSSSSIETGKVFCINENDENGYFALELPNSTYGSAENRYTYINFKFLSATNNVNGITNLTYIYTAYQAGKKIPLENPKISYTWSPKDNYFSNFSPNEPIKGTASEDLDKKIVYGPFIQFKWKDNSGTKARVYNLNNNKITFKNNPENQEDNTGGEQILELTNFGYENKVETDARSTYIDCKFVCENCKEGSQAQINSEYVEAIVNGNTEKYENASSIPTGASIIGVGSSIKVSQKGQTWPDPEIIVKIVAKPHPTNPSNVTNDETKKPVCWICQEGSTPTSNEAFISLSKTKQNKVKLYFNDIRPASIGASNTGTINTTDSLTFSSDGGRKDIIIDGSNITFNDSYIPAMGECKWDIIIERADTIPNVNGTCSVDILPKTVTVPGNDVITGKSSPVKINATLTGNTNYNSNATQISLTKTKKNDAITISIGENKASASFAKVSDINVGIQKVTANITTDIVNASERNATLTLTSNTDSVKFGGFSLSKYIQLTQTKDIVTGNLIFNASKKSGGNAVFTPSTNVNYADDTNVEIGTFSPDSGNIIYEPTINNVTIPSEGVTDKKITPTNNPTIVSGSDTTFTLSGIISSNKVAEGTPILFRNKTTTDITISPGPSIEDNDDYYEWTFNPVSNLPYGTVTIPKTTGRTIKLSCVANPNESSTGATDSTEGWNIVDQTNYGTQIKNDIIFYYVTAGYGGIQLGRSLGTIKVKYTKTNETDTAEVYQNGSDAGPKQITRTFTIIGRNCTVTADTSVTSTVKGDTKNAIISNVTRINTEFYGAKLNDFESYATKYYPKYSSNDNNYYIGAFDTPIDVLIGCVKSSTSSSGRFNITLPCYVDITCNENKQTRHILMDDIKMEGRTGIPLQDNCVEYEFTWSIPGNDNYKTSENTITVTTTPNIPGSRTYTLKTVKVTINNPSGINQNKIVATANLNYTWTFDVDSKHYYNG